MFVHLFWYKNGPFYNITTSSCVASSIAFLKLQLKTSEQIVFVPFFSLLCLEQMLSREFKVSKRTHGQSNAKFQYCFFFNEI